MKHRTGRVITALSCAAAVLALTACAHRPHLQWPWHAKSAPAPQAVEVIVIRSEDGVPVRAFPQFWVRNAVLIDLSGAAGTGTIVLTPRQGATWPVRLAFRVRPTEIKMLEISAEQRQIWPTSTDSGETVDLDVTPGLYSPDTRKITVHW